MMLSFNPVLFTAVVPKARGTCTAAVLGRTLGMVLMTPDIVFVATRRRWTSLEKEGRIFGVSKMMDSVSWGFRRFSYDLFRSWFIVPGEERAPTYMLLVAALHNDVAGDRR